MDERERYKALLERQELRGGDVIFVMQGDGTFRAPYAAHLYQEGLAPLVALVGNATDRSYGSFSSSEVRDELVRFMVPEHALHFEETCPHTRAEAERGVQLAKEKSWETILILTSPHHQYRAFLTFLKAMRDARLDIKLVNAVASLPWDEPLPWGTRRELLTREFDKIDEYRKKGDVASYEEGIAYLREHI